MVSGGLGGRELLRVTIWRLFLLTHAAQSSSATKKRSKKGGYSTSSEAPLEWTGIVMKHPRPSGITFGGQASSPMKVSTRAGSLVSQKWEPALPTTLPRNICTKQTHAGQTLPTNCILPCLAPLFGYEYRVINPVNPTEWSFTPPFSIQLVYNPIWVCLFLRVPFFGVDYKETKRTDPHQHSFGPIPFLRTACRRCTGFPHRPICQRVGLQESLLHSS